MRKKWYVSAIFVACLLGAGGVNLAWGESSITLTDNECFFLRSLHATARGMAYWYGKDVGGLETITNVPYSKLGCNGCHVQSCDRCHRTTTGKKMSYTLKAAQKQDMCLQCHGREQALHSIDRAAKQEDVHVANGMQCTDCHSAREMHGDGTIYKSYREPGAMDTHCEKCHDAIKPSDAHTVHEGKLDCKACHVRHVISCTNCHFDHMAKTNERKAIPVSGWMFLMNYRGKVTSANMQTFVVRPDKTFLLFAPAMSHSIMKQGRKCDDCHGAKNMIQAKKDKALKLTWLENGKVQNLKGVVPVVKGLKYDSVYQDLVDGKWVPIKNPKAPLIQYPAFGEPLSLKQLDALQEPQEASEEKK